MTETLAREVNPDPRVLRAQPDHRDPPVSAERTDNPDPEARPENLVSA